VEFRLHLAEAFNGAFRVRCQRGGWFCRGSPPIGIDAPLGCNLLLS
jgi:hypothetical protein